MNKPPSTPPVGGAFESLYLDLYLTLSRRKGTISLPSRGGLEGPFLLHCNLEAFAINRYHYDTSRSSDSLIVRVQYFVSYNLT